MGEACQFNGLPSSARRARPVGRRRSCFDAGLDLQSRCYSPIMLNCHFTLFDAALYFQAARHRLIVLMAYIAGLHIRFDVHRVFPFLERLWHGLPPTYTGEKGRRNCWPRECFSCPFGEPVHIRDPKTSPTHRRDTLIFLIVMTSCRCRYFPPA